MNFFGSKQKKKTPPIVPFSKFSASREQRERPERKKAEIHFLVPGILWILFVASVAYLLFFSQETTVRDTSFIGNETISAVVLEAKVNEVISGKYFSVFPKNNFFFLPKPLLIRSLEEISPKIRSVVIQKTFPSKIEIVVTERPEVVVWRSEEEEFLLDEEGVAVYHPNLSAVRSELFSFVVYDEAGRQTKTGDIVMEKDVPLFIGTFVQQFENHIGKALTHEVWVPSRFSGELLFHAEEGFDILLDSHLAIDDTLATLQAAMERGINEKDRGRLSRIDLRTENKVYYTVKEQ